MTAKRFVYDGFKAALAAGVPRGQSGHLGGRAVRRSVPHRRGSAGPHDRLPRREKWAGEFDFEYGEDFAKHIEAVHPTFCKVQVRYNPRGKQELNRRQADRLKRLSDYLHSQSKSLFMCELLLPPEKEQLEELKGDKNAYHLEMRPRLKIEAIQQLQDAQVEPDVWESKGSSCAMTAGRSCCSPRRP